MIIQLPKHSIIIANAVPYLGVLLYRSIDMGAQILSPNFLEQTLQNDL